MWDAAQVHQLARIGQAQAQRGQQALPTGNRARAGGGLRGSSGGRGGRFVGECVHIGLLLVFLLRL